MSFEFKVKDFILLEDDYILVVNKPSGLMVEPDRNNHPNLLHCVKKYISSPESNSQEVYAQHIHRLDRPVSGVILFAKQKSVLKNLSEQFAERKVKKYYNALTESAPLSLQGQLTHWHQKYKKKALLTEEKNTWNEKAVLTYSVKQHSEKRFLWDIELHTGKFHQIRAQLAAVGCPIIGDVLYGSAVPYQQAAIALHARQLVFFHPITHNELTVACKNNFDHA